MDESRAKLVLGLGLTLAFGVAIYLARALPGMFGNTAYLGGLIFLQFLLLALWHFRRLFFLFLMVGFLWAGLDLPMAVAWVSGRWAILAAGALAGFVVYMSQPQHRYGAFHLLAATGVVASFISALVSEVPAVSFLKAVSLFLLFLYASSGGRAGIAAQPVRFISGLVLGCEILAYGTAVVYFGLKQETWGNPNSLGLAMAIMAPVLLWGYLISYSRPVRWRRSFALLLTLVLLIRSNSRASLLSAAITLIVLCLAIRKTRLLVAGIALALALLSGFAILAPSKLGTFASESRENIIYKGHRDEGLLGSRRSPWQLTMDSLKRHPWLGTGFGTSSVDEPSRGAGVYASSTATTREHGSSYLAILEWGGLLGSLPLFFLLFLLLRKIVSGFLWLYREGDAMHPAVPMMALLLTGLLHASFEDWLFAVGFYATVLFWTLAFSFMDVLPEVAPAETRATPAWQSVPASLNRFGLASPIR